MVTNLKLRLSQMLEFRGFCTFGADFAECSNLL